VSKISGELQLLTIKKSLESIHYKTEILSGLTVALALVPESIAFALVAKVPPLVGLYAAFIVALITSIFGGRPGMISGATGALAVVMVSLVAKHGVDYLFATVVLMGIFQVLFGSFRFGKFIRLVPHPVIYGFVNGLAIVIFLAQFGQFKDLAGNWLPNDSLMLMGGLIALTMAMIYGLPKLTKAIPAALVAIVVVSGLVIVFGLDTKTVGDIASIKGGLPVFRLPSVPFSFETFWIIAPYSLILAGIGLIESLLTLTLVDELTETRGNSNKECVAQGAANIVTGFFGGMGGCAMIGQSIINITSGGRTRLSGITAGLALLSFILFGSALIERVPIAALIGLMFMVSIGTFEWASFRILNKVPKSDVFVMILVTVLTLVFDLAIAVLVGVIVSALVFAWDNATRIDAKVTTDKSGARHYELFGALFFASTASFLDKFTPASDPDHVVIDFKESRIADHSGIDAVQKITERYAKLGKKVVLRHLSADCVRLLGRAKGIVEVNLCEDPEYKVVS